MSIAKLKNAALEMLEKSNSAENSLGKKLESISSNFKSTPSIIAKDLQIEGEVFSSGLIEIEGNIKGKINGNSVILREEGRIEGEVIAESFNIRGKFNGNVKAKNISITSKAKITGTIEYGSLSVEDGAYIDGQFKQINTK